MDGCHWLHSLHWTLTVHFEVYYAMKRHCEVNRPLLHYHIFGRTYFVLFCFRSKSKYLRKTHIEKERHIYFFLKKIFFNWILVDLQRVLVSGVQQSDSVIHIRVPTVFSFFSHMGHYRILSRVPCAIQQILINYLFYI